MRGEISLTFLPLTLTLENGQNFAWVGIHVYFYQRYWVSME